MRSQSQTLVGVILVGAAFLAGVDLFIVNVSLDQIGADLGSASLADLSWVLNAYAVVYAALLIPMGRLTDRYGRKTGFVAGLTIFTLASAACGLADSVWLLVVFRAIQAIGAAAMTPASLGLLLAALPPERRAGAARWWALTGALAASVGPVLGGVLVQFSWRWAFWINVPVGVLLVLGAILRVPEVRHNEGAPHPDFLGGVALALAIGGLVLGLVQGNDWGWFSAGVLTAWVVAAGAVGAFIWRTARHPSPLVDPALLKIRAFSSATIVTFIYNAAFGAVLLGLILWMQHAWAYDSLRTGLAVGLGPLAVPVSNIAAQKFAPRATPATLVILGGVISMVGCLLLAVTLSDQPRYWLTVAPGWLLLGVGVGLVMPNLVAAATTSLPAEQVSTGGGIVNTARQIGVAVGVAVLVAILGAVADWHTAMVTALAVAAALAGCSAVAAVSMRPARVRTAVTARL